MAERQQQAVLLKPGLGKTASTLTALRDLDVRRTLVLAPAQVVAQNVWGREAQAWDHLRQISVVPLRGNPAQRRRALGVCPPCWGHQTVDVMSYELALWLTDEVGDLAGRYNAIVFDELSKLKAPGTSRFKRLRAKARDIPVRFGLTGSPVGNRLLDIWGEMFVVAGEKPLGPTLTGFRQRYFEPEGWGDRRFAVWKPKLGADKEIHERIKPWAFSLDEKLAAGHLPELRVNPIELELPRQMRDLEATLAHECRARLASGEELHAIGAAALGGKVRQLASGAVYLRPGEEAWEEVHPAKIDALRELVDEAQGEPMLCFYWFRHELERIQKAFPEAREVREPGAVEAWDRRELPLLLAHPQSAGHGLNLQAGGSTVVWFALPWSHELWEQGNGRVSRVGQLAPFVTAHALLAGDADWAVLESLREKGRTQAALLDAVGWWDPVLD